ncbi:hypothetical protein GCM10017788_28750 [Amycolatopsis acidiphila]|nr:hypothetical protein GCM10017788_28750 [Amycolatopsis acidiphila]
MHSLNPVVCVGVEVDGVGNLDDIVRYRTRPPHHFAQVKYTVDSTSPINESYLLTPSTKNAKPLLAKIVAAWRRLIETDEPFEMSLITNRAPDPDDPLLALRDSRTQLLMPRAGEKGPSSTIGRARRRWAQAAGVDEITLLRVFEDLRFDLARDPAHVLELTQYLMAATGLRHDDAAVNAGVSWVGQQVRDGHRELTAEIVREAISKLDLLAGPARAILSIATLKPDPLREEADYALDWADRFQGDTAYSKRRPAPPAGWDQLQRDIEAAPGQLPRGTPSVAITGSIRLAPAFLVGTAFRMVTGADLAVLQRGQLWSTNDRYGTPLRPMEDDIRLDQGPDLAVGVAIAADLTADVVEFLRMQEIPAERLLILRPPGGTADNSIPDAATANALAIGIRDAIRRASRTASRIHLFMAAPMGLALMLGHRWNRIRPTTVYEDISISPVYEAAFEVDA